MISARIAALFDVGDTSTFAALDALRTVPSKRMPTELFRHLDRLDAVRAFNLRPSQPRGVPATTLERLARVARVGKPSAIAALQEPRRTATIAALFHTLEAAAQDDAAELAEALLSDIVKRAEAADKQARLRPLPGFTSRSTTTTSLSCSPASTMLDPLMRNTKLAARSSLSSSIKLIASSAQSWAGLGKPAPAAPMIRSRRPDETAATGIGCINGSDICDSLLGFRL